MIISMAAFYSRTDLNFSSSSNLAVNFFKDGGYYNELRSDVTISPLLDLEPF